jgi:hypothetical protein
MMRPIPVEHYLVPEPDKLIPEGFTLLEQKILQGMPHTITLNDFLTLTLLIPNGLAHEWRDADPEAVVCTSEDEYKNLTQAEILSRSSLPRASVHLIVKHSQLFQESETAVIGQKLLSPSNGQPEYGIKLELVLFDWHITAGTMRSIGDYGSYIRLAWREQGKALDDYGIPPINPNIVRRIPHVPIPPRLLAPRRLFDVRVFSAVAYHYRLGEIKNG